MLAKNLLLTVELRVISNHSRRVKESLACIFLLFVHYVKNLREVWFDSFVSEHSVGLIEHQELQVRKVLNKLMRVVAQLMHKASRSSDNNVRDFV
jgi:hypothetical protein